MVDRARPSGLATIGQVGPVAAVAREETGEHVAGMRRLPAAEFVERNVQRALQPAFSVPRGLAVADVVDDGAGMAELAANPCASSEISGASGCFMPTM